MGLHRAGFDVTGVDIRPQKNYPFTFILGNALEADLSGYDFVWASPPCQAHTALKTMHNARRGVHLDLIPETREKLTAWGGQWIIENVPGSTLARGSVMLCGTMFGLGTGLSELRRHRWFESPSQLLVPECQHGERVIGIYRGHGRDRKRVKPTTIGVYGGGHGTSLQRAAKGQRNFNAAEQREAMGIDWMTVDDLSQAIPPAYSQFLARQIIRNLKPLKKPSV